MPTWKPVPAPRLRPACAQALVVCTTAAVFMFSKSMDAEGAYRVQQGAVVREADIASSQKLRHWYSDLGKETADGSAVTPRTRTCNLACTRTCNPACTSLQLHVHLQADVRGVVEPPPPKDIYGVNLFMPLLYVPLIPLVVVGLRGRVAPVTIQRISMGLIGSGLFHAGIIMFSDSSMTMD